MKNKLLLILTASLLLAFVLNTHASSVDYIKAYKKFAIEELNLGVTKIELEINQGISKAKILGTLTGVPNVPEPDLYVLATDDDFEYKADLGAPNSYKGPKGYFKYIGSHDYVIVPETIDGYVLKDCFAMFRETPVKGVAHYGTAITDMTRMFEKSSSETLDLSRLNTSNVTNMFLMFLQSKAVSLDLSSFDTSSVIKMTGMFDSSRATSINLSNFNTSKVTEMDSMFNGSWATSLDLSSFDTSNVTTMYAMFSLAKATSLDLSNFDTSKVRTMMAMFSSNKAVVLNLSSFNTSSVTNMEDMFGSSQATTLDLSNFDTSAVKTMENMFYRSLATVIDVSSFDTSNVTDMKRMFAGSKATVLDLASFDTSNVTDLGMYCIFENSIATTGYAKTQLEADKFNANPEKPWELTFTVK